MSANNCCFWKVNIFKNYLSSKADFMVVLFHNISGTVNIKTWHAQLQKPVYHVKRNHSITNILINYTVCSLWCLCSPNGDIYIMIIITIVWIVSHLDLWSSLLNRLNCENKNKLKVFDNVIRKYGILKYMLLNLQCFLKFLWSILFEKNQKRNIFIFIRNWM